MSEARIRWRQAATIRGAGRLLGICEQMATPLHTADDTPALSAAAVRRGVTSLDWTTNARPSGCRLDSADYTILLRDRVTSTVLEPNPTRWKVTAPPGAVVVTWTGTAIHCYRSTGDPTVLPYPGTDHAAASTGVAVFIRRGDATGWLRGYQSIARPRAFHAPAERSRPSRNAGPTRPSEGGDGSERWLITCAGPGIRWGRRECASG